MIFKIGNVKLLSEHKSIQNKFGTLQADSLTTEPEGKYKNTGVGSLSLLQQIFPTQESKVHLLHSRQILYQLSYIREAHGKSEA